MMMFVLPSVCLNIVRSPNLLCDTVLIEKLLKRFIESPSGMRRAFSALSLLVGQQAGHLVTDKKLYLLILQCFDAVGWVRRRASHL